MRFAQNRADYKLITNQSVINLHRAPPRVKLLFFDRMLWVVPMASVRASTRPWGNARSVEEGKRCFGPGAVGRSRHGVSAAAHGIRCDSGDLRAPAVCHLPNNDCQAPEMLVDVALDSYLYSWHGAEARQSAPAIESRTASDTAYRTSAGGSFQLRSYSDSRNFSSNCRSASLRARYAAVTGAACPACRWIASCLRERQAVVHQAVARAQRPQRRGADLVRPSPRTPASAAPGCRRRCRCRAAGSRCTDG